MEPDSRKALSPLSDSRFQRQLAKAWKETAGVSIILLNVTFAEARTKDVSKGGDKKMNQFLDKN